MPAPFPFAAIVGQSEMKKALTMAAADPSIGGVMVFGDRGTGKSTAVRALAAMLPAISFVRGCSFNCDPSRSAEDCPAACLVRANEGSAGAPAPVELRPIPVVDMPLGASEDRIVGALNLERALTTGEKAFEPGLLAKAHRGFLYIDEINLLEDHLVDLLLDAAASGENIVEREGLSVRHPARFVIVGSGNPEEGELRPQLLDRFGLSVEVTTPTDLSERVEVLRRREAFDRDPAAFAERWREENDELAARIEAARLALPDVELPDEALETISRICLSIGADGARGELTLMRAARALAALAAEGTVRREHILEAAPLALRHRLRRDPLDPTGSSARVERALEEALAP
ncbi:MAG: magnesium chelatase ATPase subunit I [Pseudomonadota bacterium]